MHTGAGGRNHSRVLLCSRESGKYMLKTLKTNTLCNVTFINAAYLKHTYIHKPLTLVSGIAICSAYLMPQISIFTSIY